MKAVQEQIVNNTHHTILNGDAKQGLSSLKPLSLNNITTSSPYWNARDYHVANQLGHEVMPEEFIKNLVDILSAAWPVLRDDGSLYANMGDKYWGGGNGPSGNFGVKNSERVNASKGIKYPKHPYYKNGDLCLIPAKFAIAMQEFGWYLREEIIWQKENCKPESIHNRCTKNYEYVYHFTKKPKYYYDWWAISEELKHPNAKGMKFGGTKYPSEKCDPTLTGNVYDASKIGRKNRRAVWNIHVKGYRAAHFATFPSELAERCLKATTSEYGCCSVCGAPWERVIKNTKIPDRESQVSCGSDVNGDYTGTAVKDYASAGAEDASKLKKRILKGMTFKDVNTWRPTCGHGDAPIVPCTVCDPFAGSGTVGEVAYKLGLNSVLIELSPKYCEDIILPRMTSLQSNVDLLKLVLL